MPIKSVLSGVASSAKNPVGTGLTALERSGDLSHNFAFSEDQFPGIRKSPWQLIIS